MTAVDKSSWDRMSYNHIGEPVLASKAYTLPASVPTYTRPVADLTAFFASGQALRVP